MLKHLSYCILVEPTHNAMPEIKTMFMYPYDLSIFEWMDWVTFEVLDDSHQKDKNHVHFRNKIIKWADLETFKPIGKCPASYVSTILHRQKLLIYNWEQSRKFWLNTFEVLRLSCEYAKDNNNLYYRWEILENAWFWKFWIYFTR